MPTRCLLAEAALAAEFLAEDAAAAAAEESPEEAALAAADACKDRALRFMLEIGCCSENVQIELRLRQRANR